MEHNNYFNCGYFRPYWLSSSQPVLVIHVQVPVEKDIVVTGRLRETTKTESKAQRARDTIRRQNCIENKISCAAMPFFGLEDDEIRDKISSKVVLQEEQLVMAKLRRATEKIQNLQEVNLTLKTTTIYLQSKCDETVVKLKDENEENTKLLQSVELESNNVIKFLKQNVTHQKEIETLKKELNTAKCECTISEELLKAENTKVLRNTLSASDRHIQNLSDFIESLPRHIMDPQGLHGICDCVECGK